MNIMPKTILHIERDQEYVQMMRTMLSTVPELEVIDLPYLDNLIEDIRHSQPDLILTDLALLQFPHVVEAYENLKREPDLRHIPVMAVSAFDKVAQQHAAKYANYDIYVASSFSPSEIRGQVKSLLGIL